LESRRLHAGLELRTWSARGHLCPEGDTAALNNACIGPALWESTRNVRPRPAWHAASAGAQSDVKRNFPKEAISSVENVPAELGVGPTSGLCVYVTATGSTTAAATYRTRKQSRVASSVREQSTACEDARSISGRNQRSRGPLLAFAAIQIPVRPSRARGPYTVRHIVPRLMLWRAA
jgi:hypothetical protein